MYNPKALTGGRFGVNQTVYYYGAGKSEHKSYNSTYSAACQMNEAPYERNLRVTQEWQQLDVGWFRDYPDKQPEEMLLINEEGSLLQRIPTEEEKAEIASRIVEVGVATGELLDTKVLLHASNTASIFQKVAIIKPGRSLRYSPQEIGRVWLRCRKGVARVSLILIPE